MSDKKYDMKELAETITGFEEVAIERFFGSDFSTFAQRGGTMLARVLLSIALTRDGMKAVDAHQTAMAMPLRDVEGRFLTEDAPAAVGSLEEDGEDVAGGA